MNQFLRRAAAGFLLCAAGAAAAQDYPSKPIRLVVSFSAGGTTDILAREVAHQLSTRLKQTVVVENRPGAGGNIGTEFLSKSAPDGYTLLATSVGPVAINPTLYANLKVNPQTALLAVAPIADVPNVLVVHPDLPAKNVAELVAYAKKRPDKLNYGSTGIGTAAHLSGVLFAEKAGVDVVHVPYKGADALNDLIAGRIDFMFATIPSVIGHIRAGQLRPLAVASAKRSEALPDTPTMAQAGVPDVVTGAWFGLFAPVDTPPAVVATLNQAVNESIASADVQKRLLAQGAEPMRMDAAAFGSFVAAEYASWRPIVLRSGARID
ncbi:tripartite tricarboxylate transporter substrate binding protein [Achromobacter spanius]|uniref:Bug family tripartite tricarboxylate transporter substrate binding protein n=1 Tax=Achromobacter spanius TaxID=217203 RepID=UPI003209E9B4